MPHPHTRCWLAGFVVLILAPGCDSSPPGQGLTNPSAEAFDTEKPGLRDDMPPPPGADLEDADAEVEAAVADETP